MIACHHGWRTWLAGAVLAICAVGCQAFRADQRMPADPLFAGHKPPESKAEQAAAAVLAFSEPAAPIDSYAAWAKNGTQTPHMLPGDLSRGSVPGVLMNRSTPQKTDTPQ